MEHSSIVSRIDREYPPPHRSAWEDTLAYYANPNRKSWNEAEVRYSVYGTSIGVTYNHFRALRVLLGKERS